MMQRVVGLPTHVLGARHAGAVVVDGAVVVVIIVVVGASVVVVTVVVGRGVVVVGAGVPHGTRLLDEHEQPKSHAQGPPLTIHTTGVGHGVGSVHVKNDGVGGRFAIKLHVPAIEKSAHAGPGVGQTPVLHVCANTHKTHANNTKTIIYPHEIRGICAPSNAMEKLILFDLQPQQIRLDVFHLYIRVAVVRRFTRLRDINQRRRHAQEPLHNSE